jgi:ribonuclease BN (tRNA processing enzyme)
VPAGALHLDAAAVGALAAATRPARILLTHLQMRRDPGTTVTLVRAAFDGPVDLVRDGDRFTV